MKIFNTTIGKLLPVTAILTTLVLAACAPNQLVTNACHATGDALIPYEEVAVDNNNVGEHLNHPNDLWPVPVNGCPTILVIVTDGKVTICHATSSGTNPYNEITIDRNGLNGHGDHEGDIIPAPDSGCPDTFQESIDGKITICHATSSENNPYNEITISINGLNGHGDHEGDIIPMPAGGCPTS